MPCFLREKTVWTNGRESSSQVFPQIGIGPWMVLSSLRILGHLLGTGEGECLGGSGSLVLQAFSLCNGGMQRGVDAPWTALMTRFTSNPCIQKGGLSNRSHIATETQSHSQTAELGAKNAKKKKVKT